MLYAQAPGAMIVYISIATGLVLTGMRDMPASRFLWWILLLLAMLAARSILIFAFLRADKLQERSSGAEDHSARPAPFWERAYAMLVVVGALHLALWPLFFFPGLSLSGRLIGALILSAMAGGGIALLSMVRWLALTFGALVLLPASTMLILSGGPDERICGVLGYIYWFAMIFSVGRTYRRLTDSMMLSHQNTLLVEQLNQQSDALIDSNHQLATAQHETEKINHALEQRIAERTHELQQLATRDSLTGLANRTCLIDIAEACFAPGQPPITLFFADLDGFKEINDSMGHAVGDSVLHEVARRIGVAAEGAVAISRWGGDEFVILRKSEADPDDDLRFAESLIWAMRDPLNGHALPVLLDACVGIARYPDDGSTLQDLIYGADMAVYAAKDVGRGKVRTFTDALAEAGRRRAQIRKALAFTLAEDCVGLSLVYQPVFDNPSLQVVSVEALLRWHHSELGQISPGEFIPLAEKSGEIIAVGEWVLHKACGFAAGLDQETLPEICVNVSVRQLLHPNFFGRVQAALSDSGLSPERLVLELTESVFISDYEQVSKVFAALEIIGVKIAIDDFGTGYSSLSYLRRVPASTLKIDGSFVATIDNGSWPIIEASVSLARAFGMKVVAEGVETEAQLGALTMLGVDRIQGYLLGRPVPAEDLRLWLSSGAQAGADAVHPLH